MTISLLIHWALVEIILAFDSVSEFGNGISDPVMSSFESSDGYLSNDMVVKLLREDAAPIVTDEFYEGYRFNERKCIQFNNRILCGYNTNIGDKVDDYKMVDLGNGCRTRGDRIECGYERKVIKHRKANVRQAPTRTSMTSMTTNPQFVLKNKIKTDILEKNLLKSAFALMKSMYAVNVPTATEMEPSLSETPTSESSTRVTSSSYMLSTSTDIPIASRLLVSPEMQSTESTSEKTTIAKDEITSTASTNNTSPDAITKTVTLDEFNKHTEPAVQKTTILTKILSTLPELVTESNLDIAGLLREQSTNRPTSSRSDLRNKTSDDSIKTSCVENDDRIVCYNYKT